MKAKALVATLLVAAAASADARLASPYPRKAVPPDESGHWIVINGNSWSHGVKSEPATFADGQTRPAAAGSGRQVRVAAATEKSPPTRKNSALGKEISRFCEMPISNA